MNPQDIRKLDDDQLISERANLRRELERCPPRGARYNHLDRLYRAVTQEFDRRARAAWSEAS